MQLLASLFYYTHLLPKVCVVDVTTQKKDRSLGPAQLSNKATITCSSYRSALRNGS